MRTNELLQLKNPHLLVRDGAMSPLRSQFKVLYLIIGSVVVLMVNQLPRQQGTTEMACHDETMFKYPSILLRHTHEIGFSDADHAISICMFSCGPRIGDSPRQWNLPITHTSTTAASYKTSIAKVYQQDTCIYPSPVFTSNTTNGNRGCTVIFWPHRSDAKCLPINDGTSFESLLPFHWSDRQFHSKSFSFLAAACTCPRAKNTFGSSTFNHELLSAGFALRHFRPPCHGVGFTINSIA